MLGLGRVPGRCAAPIWSGWVRDGVRVGVRVRVMFGLRVMVGRRIRV